MKNFINFIKHFKSRKGFLETASNKNSYFVTWNKHDMVEDKQYQLNTDLDFIPRTINPFFDSGIIFNFELEKAYLVRKLNSDSLNIIQVEFDEFIKDGWVVTEEE